MGCSASSIETDSITISSDVQREQSKISPIKLQDELQECVVESQNEHPNDDCTQDEGSVRSFPILNKLLENATASRPVSSRSKHSIRSHKSNNGDPITGASLPTERPISGHSNKSRRSTSSKENSKSLKSPNISLKLDVHEDSLPTSEETDEEVEGKYACSSETVTSEPDKVLKTEVTTESNVKESEEGGESDNAQGLKEPQNMDLPSASEKYRTEMAVAESNNENHSEDEGIGFEKLDTISISEEKYLAPENADQLLEDNILQSTYWEDLGINIGAPSAEKSTDVDADASIDDMPEVELTLPVETEETSCRDNKIEEEPKNENDDELFTQDSKSNKELRIDIHECEDVLQQSEGGHSKLEANDNEALLWMEKNENKSQNQNDDSAISLSDLLSDIDSSEEAPCSLAASSSGLVLPRPATSKRREDVSNTEFLIVPCATSENGSHKYIDTIEIEALNEVNNNIANENKDDNLVDEAEMTTEDQRNEEFEVLAEALTSTAGIQSNEQSNEEDSEKNLLEVASKEAPENGTFSAVQSEQNNEDVNNEDISPDGLGNKIQMTTEDEASLLKAADENLLGLQEENIEKCQQNETDRSPYQAELDKGEEQLHEVNNNDDTIEVNDGSESQDNNVEATLNRQHGEALADQESQVLVCEEGTLNQIDNVNVLQKMEMVEMLNEVENFNDVECNTKLPIKEQSKEDDCLFEWSSEDERIVGMLKDDVELHEKNNEIKKEDNELKQEINAFHKESYSLEKESNGLEKESSQLQVNSNDLNIKEDQLLEEGNDLQTDNENFQKENSKIQEESDHLQEESNDIQTDNENLLKETGVIQEEIDQWKEGNNDSQTYDEYIQKENEENQNKCGQLQKESDDFLENGKIQKGCTEELANMQLTQLPEGVIIEQENEVIDNFVETRKKEANLVEQIENKIDELLSKDDISEESENPTVTNEKIQKVIRFVLPEEEDFKNDIEAIYADANINLSGLANSEVQDDTMNSRQGEAGDNCENSPEEAEDVRKKIISDLSREVSFKGCKLEDTTYDNATGSKINTCNISKQTLGSQEDLLRSVSRQSVTSMTLKLGDISNLSGVEIKHVGRITSQKPSSNIDKEASEGEILQPVMGF